MFKKVPFAAVCVILLATFSSGCLHAEKSPQLKALIIDGQNNHFIWPKSTIMMKQYLEESGLFEVDVDRTQYTWKGKGMAQFLPMAFSGDTTDLEKPKSDPDFAPNFSDYDVVISNFGWKAADWSESTQKALEDYMENGGGFVSVHAADNSFPEWKAYNLMIGLGGWGGRNHTDGPYVYYNEAGELIRDTSPGGAGAHGPKHVFPITVRVADHPITQGMPSEWLVGADECYAKLRGPAENMTVLATGRDQNEKAPTQRHEPILMVIDYGEGRIFHTTLGHDGDSFESVGFIASFLRGTEWAASGKVTQVIPEDFPTATENTSRKFEVKQ
ncbi:MAG: ThuA domain-containing protein [Opitutaceae bacterium]